MRPTLAETRDPLNLPAMPPMDGLELDYRTGAPPQGFRGAAVGRYLVSASFAGIVVLIALRLSGLLDVLTSPFVLACVVLLCCVAALYHYLYLSHRYVCIAWLVAGPTIWFLIIVTHGAGQFLLCLAPIGFATYVARAMVLHHGAWMHANPHMGREDRLAWRGIWASETARDTVASPVRLSARSEWRERRRFTWAFSVVWLAATLALMTYASRRPFAGIMALTLFTSVLVLFGVINTLDYPGARVSLFKCAGCVWRAIVSWFTYNPGDVVAPGVFQSPGGWLAHRHRMTQLAIGALATTVVPLASYFPVAVMAAPAEQWLRAASRPLPWIEGGADRGVPIPAPPTRNQVLARLTQAQRVYLDQLSSENQRRRYLNQVATVLHQAAVTEAFQPAFDRLTTPPESWLLVAAIQVYNGQTQYVWALTISLAMCLIAGPVVFFAVCFAVGARTLAHFYLTLDAPDARYHRSDTVSAWDAYQKRLAESRHLTQDRIGRRIRERDHLLIGLNTINDYPVLLHQDILTEHAHFTGDSGSGKSALGIAPILTQLIGRPASSIVVLDLKGDRALFECARLEAQRQGIPFRWFTNQPNSATFAFNPFLQAQMKQISRVQLAEVLLKSMGLEYGGGYGRAYFSSMHRDVLTKLLVQFPEIDSFRLLYHYLTNARDYIDVTREQQSRGAHLITTVGMLAAIDALNVRPNDAADEEIFARRIDMSEVVANPNVVYFHLKTQLQEATMSEVAKLALFSLLTAAVLNPARDHQVYLFVDEFQQIVSSDIEIVLRMARDSGIATILANQTISDLVTHDADLRPTVQANTRFKLVYSATDLAQQDDVIKASGEALYEMFNVTESFEKGPRGFSRNEQIGPRIRRNDVILASDDENRSIAHISRGRGYTQFGGFPFPMYTAFHIPNEEYVRRRKAPPPEPAAYPGSFVEPLDGGTRGLPATPAQQPPPAAEARPVPSDPVEQGRIDDIGVILDEF